MMHIHAAVKRLSLSACVVLLVPVACNNAATETSVLRQFQNSTWPQYQAERVYREDGKIKEEISTVNELRGLNELVSRSETKEGSRRICRTVLTDFEDHQRRECESQSSKSLSLNTLDANGRIIATVFDPGGNEPVRTGQYEYNGNTETFYGYTEGILNTTVLTEKWPGRKKYTTWDNADPAAPAIHVRDYLDSGEGSEFYISTKNGGMRETLRTRVFQRDTQKVTVEFEVSYEYPNGVFWITTSDWDKETGSIEKVYRLDDAQTKIEAIADLAEARSLIKSAKLVREKNTGLKRPVA